MTTLPWKAIPTQYIVSGTQCVCWQVLKRVYQYTAMCSIFLLNQCLAFTTTCKVKVTVAWVVFHCDWESLPLAGLLSHKPAAWFLSPLVTTGLAWSNELCIRLASLYMQIRGGRSFVHLHDCECVCLCACVCRCVCKCVWVRMFASMCMPAEVIATQYSFLKNKYKTQNTDKNQNSRPSWEVCRLIFRESLWNSKESVCYSYSNV